MSRSHTHPLPLRYFVRKIVKITTQRPCELLCREDDDLNWKLCTVACNKHIK
jgi:hypothetical protein